MTRPARHLRLVATDKPDYAAEICVDVVSDEGVVLITVWGEIDIQTGPQISAAFSAALERHASSIFVDLAEVSFFGVAGATALLGAKQKCQQKGVNFTLLRASHSARFVLGLTGVLSPKPSLSDRRGAGQQESLRVVNSTGRVVGLGKSSSLDVRRADVPNADDRGLDDL